jgi:hypothetical protein
VTSYSDTSARRRTTYEYRVEAYDAAGPSAWSNIATVTTPNRAPQPAKAVYPEPVLPTYVKPRRILWGRIHHAVRADRNVLGSAGRVTGRPAITGDALVHVDPAPIPEMVADLGWWRWFLLTRS